jgi:hypothetical protein
MRRDEMTVRFDKDERAAIDKLASMHGLSAAAALRMLVREWMTRIDPPSARKPAKKGGR